MLTLRKDANKKPIENIIIIFILAIGIASFPTGDICKFILGEYTLKQQLLFTGIARLLFSILMVYLAVQYGFKKAFTNKPTAISLILTVPALIVAINNAPFIGYINGTVYVTGDSLDIVFFVIYCSGIGTFEEITFRGIIFPLFLIKLRNNGKCLFWSVVLSSATFGLIHLINLFGGASVGGTLLQAGYSFLVGSMCAIALIITKNIVIPIALHTVYDICGLMVAKIGVGGFYDIWNV